MARQVSLYKVLIWYHQPEGMVEKSFTLSKIRRLNNKYLKGLDATGKVIEIKTLEPFNYFLQQIK